ncbi:hypothetical protein [Adhaeribacter pallidiroseus]|uniref:Uncharacterized protein n=1 Tax=Adhaeribacter pallidiroseus TaxID=2072847 RepID=A0A369QFS8_9BACT|nr:hypothetical protein [Adhaeribacter pallidiroseus]RDC63282.1 hypothetical protein AHMF7616_01884 [Adhaeribacter pallidiroseus]
MDKIKLWLDSETKDYQEGILLLEKATKNRTLVSNLRRKENNANTAKLAYELGKIYATARIEAEANENPQISFVAIDEANQLNQEPLKLEQPVPNFPPGTPATGQNPEPPKEPEKVDAGTLAALQTIDQENRTLSLEEVDKKMQSLFNEKAMLSNTLADLATDEERAQTVKAIADKQEHYNQLAQAKQYFQEHGKFPEAEPVPNAENTEDKATLIEVRNRLRSSVSKAKKALEAKPDDVTKQEKLAKLEIELNAVEAKIKLVG